MEGEFVKQFYSEGNTLENEHRAEKHIRKCNFCRVYHFQESEELFKNLPVGKAMGEPSVPRERIREAVRGVMRADGMIP